MELEDSLLGTLLDGKYRIEKVLGQGGMAKVYRATQEPLERKVAVKVLKHMSTDAAVRDIDEKRFFREARLASKLTHPNTVIIHDYGSLGDDKGLFLVMEYLDGTSLGGLLARVGHLTWDAAYPIIKQIGGSLDEAHNKGLIHRDLKPLNIMVSQNVGAPISAKVLDFGLAKPMKENEDEQVTVKGTIIGSPLYMSPEQIFNEDVDHRSDIYSLGILAFEMLTGRPPFILSKDGHVRDLLKSHLTGAIPEMRSINPHLDVPPDVEFAIRRCLAKKSKDRYESVTEFIQTLKTASVTAGSARIHETADFTHHHLRPDPVGSAVDTVSEGQVALSTTRVGSDENVTPPAPRANSWNTKRTLLALAALLALGIGITVSVSSGNQEDAKTVAQDTQISTAAQQTETNRPTEPTQEPNESRTSTSSSSAPATDVIREDEREVAKPRNEAPSTQVKLRFVTEPAGAHVYLGNERVSDEATPFTLEVDRTNVAGTYIFKKRGFVPVKNVVESDFQGSQIDMNAELTRAPKARKKTRSMNPLRRRKR